MPGGDIGSFHSPRGVTKAASCSFALQGHRVPRLHPSLAILGIGKRRHTRNWRGTLRADACGRPRVRSRRVRALTGGHVGLRRFCGWAEEHGYGFTHGRWLPGRHNALEAAAASPAVQRSVRQPEMCPSGCPAVLGVHLPVACRLLQNVLQPSSGPTGRESPRFLT